MGIPGPTWQPDEDALLKRLFKEGLTDEEIKRRLPGRSASSIQSRRSKFGLKRRRPKKLKVEKTTPGTVKHFVRLQRDYRVYAPEATPETIAERDRAYSAPRTIGQDLLGEPLPGRSYLDRMRAAQGDRA